MSLNTIASKIIHAVANWVVSHSLSVDADIKLKWPKTMAVIEKIGSIFTLAYHAVRGALILAGKAALPIVTRCGRLIKTGVQRVLKQHPKLLAAADKAMTFVGEYRNVISIITIVAPLLAAGHHYRGHFHGQAKATPVQAVNSANDVRVIFLKPDGSYAWTILVPGTAIKTEGDSVSVTLANGAVEHWQGSYILVPFAVCSDCSSTTAVVPAKPVRHTDKTAAEPSDVRRALAHESPTSVTK
jgi:hypothetical protein